MTIYVTIYIYIYLNLNLNRSIPNLEHLCCECYEILNFDFNGKVKQTKLEAALSPLSKNLTGQNSIYKNI